MTPRQGWILIALVAALVVGVGGVWAWNNTDHRPSDVRARDEAAEQHARTNSLLKGYGIRPLQ